MITVEQQIGWLTWHAGKGQCPKGLPSETDMFLSLLSTLRQQSRLREAISDGRQKLATYQGIYSGDKELRRLLTEWDALLSEVPQK